ncbi:MAG: sulfotransferase [Cyclobacteriaceae bacterium]
MVLSINGYNGAGKSVLKGILDGHPDIFVSPTHDNSLGMFTRIEDSEEQWMKFKDIEKLREKMACYGRYFRLERFSYNKKIPFGFSSGETIYIPFELDWSYFDSRVIDRLNMLDNWNPEIIVSSIYEQLDQSLNSNDIQRKYYGGMDEPDLPYLENFFRNYPHGKMLHVERDIYSVTATLSNRKTIKDDFRSLLLKNYSVKEFIQTGRLKHLLNYLATIKKIKELHPNQILSVSFENLVLKTKSELKKICEFLNVQQHPALDNWSCLGKEVTNNGVKYIGDILDDPKVLLSNEEYHLINKEIENFGKDKQRNMSPLSRYKAHITKIKKGVFGIIR